MKRQAIILSIICTLFFALSVNADAVKITQKSASMSPTIDEGDTIIGIGYGDIIPVSFDTEIIMIQFSEPARYDIIIFKYPDDETQNFCKRIIGLPGEKVEIRDGKVYINDSEEPLDDSFVKENPVGNFGPYKVPEDSYFVLGDNRNNSKDSRFWENTFVLRDQILQRVISNSTKYTSYFR